MKSIYQNYMDRQTVSADLHSKLLTLEQAQKAPDAPSLLEIHARRWRSGVALAASLVLVVGLGFWGTQRGLFRLGSSADSSMESTAITEEPAAAEEAVWEDGDSYGFDYSTEDAAPKEPGAAPIADAATEPEESTPVEETEDSKTAALARTEQNEALLMETLPFTDEDAALRAVQLLEQAGCGRITEIEVEQDTGRVYVLNLTDEEQNVFRVEMDHEGDIGSIQDEEGNGLYAPAE